MNTVDVDSPQEQLFKSDADVDSPQEQLFKEAAGFDFFQAVRLLETIARKRAGHNAHARRFAVGEDHSPQREVVRFRALASQGFPAAALSGIEPGSRVDDSGGEENFGPAEMTVSFMGLTGPGGVLPQHYTTLMIERIRDKDYALRDFFDLFNHRGISLFYRAWEKYRHAIGYERNEHAGGDNEPAGKAKHDTLFTKCLYSLLGLGGKAPRGRMVFDDEAFLFYGGHFAHYPRSAVSLECILSDYLGLRTEIHQFQGQWLQLSEEDQSSLPTPQNRRGLNCELGATAVAGERVWNVEAKFRARLGPLDYRQFCRFTPAGNGLEPLCQLVRGYVGPHLDFDVRPVLKADEVPWCRLGGEGPDQSCLGWNTWIRSDPFDHDVDDAVFEMEGLPWRPSI